MTGGKMGLKSLHRSSLACAADAKSYAALLSSYKRSLLRDIHVGIVFGEFPGSIRCL